jgi:hypothetical protein
VIRSTLTFEIFAWRKEFLATDETQIRTGKKKHYLGLLYPCSIRVSSVAKIFSFRGSGFVALGFPVNAHKPLARPLVSANLR